MLIFALGCDGTHSLPSESASLEQHRGPKIFSRAVILIAATGDFALYNSVGTWTRIVWPERARGSYG